MKTLRIGLIAAALLVRPRCPAAPDPHPPSPSQAQKADCETPGAEAAQSEASSRASKRYEEMLAKMQAAVEEVAQLYGNPVFLQVFTNDTERAAQLKERLRLARSEKEVRREVSDLQRQRDDVLNDLALKQREASRLAARLVRQRAALDALAGAVEQAKKAVEETTN
jgi:uncharacterized protein YjiS (DUF1127 family)